MSRHDTDRAAIAAADLNDELWTWQHIAHLAGRQRSWAFAIALHPQFPAPVGDGDRLWHADEVRAFMRTWRPGRPRRTAPPRPRPGTTPSRPGQPLTMQLRPARRTA
ncbi:MAG: hypothetical protein ACTHK1_08005 [Actinomycetales bacterium]